MSLEDSDIIELYWQRDETAITKTDQKYGRFCYGIAMNILSVHEDAEECVSDTYRCVWNAVPPERPRSLSAYLGRIIRNLSFNRWNKKHAQKRYGGMELLLSELEDCIPFSESVEQTVEARELSKLINKWLTSLPRVDRALFVRRYWNGDALADLAKEYGVKSSKLAQRMFRLRKRLKASLEQEGAI